MLRPGMFQNGEVGIGMFPQCKKILIALAARRAIHSVGFALSLKRYPDTNLTDLG